MSKKLSFKETMLTCGLLREIGVKDVVKNITSKEFDSKLLTLKNTEEKQTLIALEVVTYIIENAEKGQDKLEMLLASYLSKEAELLDIDDIFDGLIAIFTSGLPKVITDLINIEGIKKKMKSKK